MQRPVGQPAGRRFGCLAGWLLASAHWEASSACPSAQRDEMQMVATKAALQMGGLEAVNAGDGVGDYDVSSGTGSSNACGGCEAVENPKVYGNW